MRVVACRSRSAGVDAASDTRSRASPRRCRTIEVIDARVGGGTPRRVSRRRGLIATTRMNAADMALARHVRWIHAPRSASADLMRPALVTERYRRHQLSRRAQRGDRGARDRADAGAAARTARRRVAARRHALGAGGDRGPAHHAAPRVGTARRRSRRDRIARRPARPPVSACGSTGVRRRPDGAGSGRRSAVVGARSAPRCRCQMLTGSCSRCLGPRRRGP